MANLPAFVKFLTDNLPSNNASLKGYKRPALALQVAASPSSAPLTREQLWSRIQAYAKPEHGFIVDAGDSWFNAQFLNLPRGARYEAQMSYASIGWSVGAGLGYSVASQHEGRKAVIVVGDGAAQMTIQEISTMIRYRQPVLMIVVDNEGYQIEEVLHKGPYNFIANWPFHALAKAFVSTTDKGAEDFTVSMLVKTETELVQAFKQVEERPNRFYLLHCKIGAEDVSKKLLEFGASMMKWNGRSLSSVMTEGCNWA